MCVLRDDGGSDPSSRQSASKRGLVGRPDRDVPSLQRLDRVEGDGGNDLPDARRRGRVLDLFCGAGGAGTGYARAGFEVVGVDIAPQPNYPFEFVEADALALPLKFLRSFDLVHASPPCQFGAAISKGTNARLRDRYPDLYPATASRLQRAGRPYVIENPDARPDLILCGEMFGLAVIRHRRFELGGWSCPQPPHPRHRGRVAGMRHGVWYEGPYFAVYGDGGGKGTVADWQTALGIDWTNIRRELAEAIPPAYTQLVGAAFTPKNLRRGSSKVQGSTV